MEAWVVDVDYSWIARSDRTSFVLDLDLACSPTIFRDMVSSMVLAGGMTGALIAGPLYDIVGPRKMSLVGLFIMIIWAVVGAFCGHYILLLAVQFFLGMGYYIANNGAYILSMDFLPAR